MLLPFCASHEAYIIKQAGPSSPVIIPEGIWASTSADPRTKAITCVGGWARSQTGINITSPRAFGHTGMCMRCVCKAGPVLERPTVISAASPSFLGKWEWPCSLLEGGSDFSSVRIAEKNPCLSHQCWWSCVLKATHFPAKPGNAFPYHGLNWVTWC